jgi:diadenosine tetraphosphate (Ap4A) HIT family hydrolase
MMYDTHNIFARILRGEIACQKIAEGSTFLAFHDAFPKAPVHVLIIPKGTYIDQHDFHTRASEDEILGLYKGMAAVIDQLDLYTDGFRQISNCGLNGGQEVPHYHIHLLSGKHLGALVSSS